MPDLTSDESPSPSPTLHHPSRDPLSIETPTSSAIAANQHHLADTQTATGSSLLIPDYNYKGSAATTTMMDFGKPAMTSHSVYAPLSDYVKPTTTTVPDNTFRPFLPTSSIDEDPYKLPGSMSTTAVSSTDWHSSLYSTYPPHHHPPPKLTPSPFISNYLHSGY